MTRLSRSALLVAGLFAVTLFLGGCSNTLTSSDLRADETPELMSVTRSEETYFNNRNRIRDNTWRQIYDDWSMIWLEDRNLRLTRYTLP